MKRMTIEKYALQAVLLLVALIPLSAGLAGVITGPAFFQIAASVSADSHMRYLSGLLLGIGILALTVIPHVERHTERMGALTLIVFVGGLSRLWALLLVGKPNAVMTAALFVELLLTPALFLWVRRVAKLSAETPQSAAPPDPHPVRR
jgi:hypothetical protein